MKTGSISSRLPSLPCAFGFRQPSYGLGSAAAAASSVSSPSEQSFTDKRILVHFEKHIAQHKFSSNVLRQNYMTLLGC